MSVACCDLSVTSMCYDSICANTSCVNFNFTDRYDCLGYFGCPIGTGPRGIAEISIVNATNNCFCVVSSPVIGEADEPWRFQEGSSYFDFTHCLLHVELMACKTAPAGASFCGCIQIHWSCNNCCYNCWYGKRGVWVPDWYKLIRMEPNMQAAGFEREKAVFCPGTYGTNYKNDYVCFAFYNRNASTTWTCNTSCVVFEIPLTYNVCSIQ